MKPSGTISRLFDSGDSGAPPAGQWPDWLVELRTSQKLRFEQASPEEVPSGLFADDWAGGGPFADAARIRPEPLNFAAVNERSLVRPHGPYLVFLNGFYSESLSRTGKIPHGVVCGSLSKHLVSQGPTLKSSWESCRQAGSGKTGFFDSLNFSKFQDGLFLRVPDKTVVEEPIQILLIDTNPSGARLAVYPRLFVLAGASSRLQLIVHQTSLAQSRPYFHCGVCELFLGPGACVDWSFIQRPQEDSIGVWSTCCHLRRHASLETLAYGDRGARVRQNLTIRLLEEHAFASFKGLSVLSGRSEHRNSVRIGHIAGHCLSRQHHKSILFDRSASEFDSLVDVRQNAVKSDSRQLSRNLIVSEGARAVSQPRLKINADDVACVHGASTGPLEASEVFYLRSRGLTEYQARSMLACGFAQEILDQVRHPELNLRLQAMAETEIERHLRKAEKP